ncbi:MULTISPECIES: pilus assembly FimT family protein [unclassified Coleofasciculus]|uniref:pilus assembly FimT family protein n=1 Tax=unclassified Coleofasciculus TaxID=2692782 RepID=UPI0018808FFC|nr:MULTISPECIES: prepilin-type N-terminal cleavage/methylation domain-containing protein [unclassified Coleofasciculus]MBE9126699.1 prepilin-type N-terminal cleavage/methylation domain-containing protein [Coleofasciculus sp. LEGE 07081]MBE9150059.1 prepilin-type N-terminal cleavage/methylation domain-containing protein [Coleofasciculus sp. LEGE 07092]
MLRNSQPIRKTAPHSTAGYTLLEQIIVVAIVSILSAIAAPQGLAFINHQRLNTAQNQVYRAMQEAKSNAMRDKITWQASFQEVNGVVQWSVHPADSINFIPSGVQWQNLGQTIRIDKEKNKKGAYETTLDSPGRKTLTGPWRVQFNDKGNTNGQLGQITLISNNDSKTKRCIYISTLIGAMRTGQEHPKPNSNKKYCY